jgi:hypothetical protein
MCQSIRRAPSDRHKDKQTTPSMDLPHFLPFLFFVPFVFFVVNQFRG